MYSCVVSGSSVAVLSSLSTSSVVSSETSSTSVPGTTSSGIVRATVPFATSASIFSVNSNFAFQQLHHQSLFELLDQHILRHIK